MWSEEDAWDRASGGAAAAGSSWVRGVAWRGSHECAEFKVERERAGFWYNIEMELGPACLRTSDISLPCFAVGFLCRSMLD